MRHYETVKAAILKAYELAPEAYRQKFRNYRKQENQTHVEYNKQKEIYLDRWRQAKKITGDYVGLKQLILMELFQNSMPEEMKTYLNERKLKSSHEMAILADEYDIVHKKKPK